MASGLATSLTPNTIPRPGSSTIALAILMLDPSRAMSERRRAATSPSASSRTLPGAPAADSDQGPLPRSGNLGDADHGPPVGAFAIGTTHDARIARQDLDFVHRCVHCGPQQAVGLRGDSCRDTGGKTSGSPIPDKRCRQLSWLDSAEFRIGVFTEEPLVQLYRSRSESRTPGNRS